MFFSRLFLVLTLLSYYVSAYGNHFNGKQIELQAQTELFILKVDSLAKNSSALYVQILNRGKNSQPVWIEYKHNSPSGKLFQINPIDKMTFSTNSLKSAFYYVLTENDVAYKAENTKSSSQLKKRLNNNLYTTLNNYLPISNSSVKERADDLYQACPTVPSRKNGKSCLHSDSLTLPIVLKKMIQESAKKYNQNPALVAAIIQHESRFDPYAENIHEKNKCLKNSKNCSPYRWGKGLSQLGASDGHFFGLNWKKETRVPRSCRGKTLLNKSCLNSLIKSCKRYKNSEFKPINCPTAAIEAVSKKLQSLIPDSLPTWVKSEQSTESSSELVNLSPALKRSKEEKLRNLIGLYNRGVKVYNSFVEFHDKFGYFPKNFGSAWSMPRTSQSPSISMGYQMLTREYIGRCYVWELAGLCGELPSDSLVAQYMRQFE